MNEKIISLIKKLENKNIHIVGLSGTEGAAITLFLYKHGIKPKNLIIHDFLKTREEFIKSFNINHVAFPKIEREQRLKKIESLNLKINFKENYLDGIKDADFIFVTQNWFNYSCNFPLLKEASDKNIPFMNITELYFTLAPCPIIGITGSCGKTTTSNMTFEILKKGPRKVFFTGNDRYAKQILEDMDNISSEDMLVMEVSNRQLINFKYSPHIGAITNLLPNHIDEHGSYENYIKTKFNIFAHQTNSDFAIINYDNILCNNFLAQIKSKPFPFSRNTIFKDNGIYEKDGKIFMVFEGKISEICSIDDIPLPGEHNIENVLAAIGASFLAGISPIQIQDGIKNFKGVKNRLELIRKVNNISYYNDLGSTTPSATLAALRVFKNNVILIAGGHDKGMDYTELAEEIKNRVKKLILLPGRGTDKLIAALERITKDEGRGTRDEGRTKNHESRTTIIVNTVEEAFNQANASAVAGDKVLLSPACANFFSLYVKDKDGFNKLVKRYDNI
ncbi:UDP-N-acetylmuramoyl-L-alanine--D-glutamate ligase [Candidatus Poribacteria bacterium]|nr:UDP-N-acetylmuramoyl-L-alanine--D-glutamate ligase [Candidatus Poribacteria bacterium]